LGFLVISCSVLESCERWPGDSDGPCGSRRDEIVERAHRFNIVGLQVSRPLYPRADLGFGLISLIGRTVKFEVEGRTLGRLNELDNSHLHLLALCFLSVLWRGRVIAEF
jgi:hypothetical protein